MEHGEKERKAGKAGKGKTEGRGQRTEDKKRIHRDKAGRGVLSVVSYKESIGHREVISNFEFRI